jgi:ubiquinone/menaquinone biosynthesis C-methylase UbiE
MSLPGKLQRAFIYERRLRRLAELLAQTIPKSYGVLDVGSGDGRLAWSLMQRRSDLAIQGVDVMMRPATQIPVKLFDGTTLPYPNSSFDAVMLIDVLHHTVDPFRLLREALRVCRNCLIVKDHLLEGFAAGLRLRILDYAGNADHGVALPYNYMSEKQWVEFETLLQVKVMTKTKKLDLYPWPVNLVFGAGLHFLARYAKSDADAQGGEAVF